MDGCRQGAHLNAYGNERTAWPVRKLTIGSILLPIDGDKVFVRGRPVSLTKAEREIMRLLLEQWGSVVTRTALRNAAWPDAAEERNAQLDAAIAALQEKLQGGDVTIESVPGIGYLLR